MRIECPHCETTYTSERCGINPAAGTVFTIICGLCGGEFDGDMVEVPGEAGTDAIVTPASALHRWTGGRFGRPEITAVAAVAATEPELRVFTRKRQ